MSCSVNEGFTWTSGPTLTGSYDVCDLPLNCFNGPTRFLGDYQESLSNRLHGHLLFTVPDPTKHAAAWSEYFSPRFRY